MVLDDMETLKYKHQKGNTMNRLKCNKWMRTLNNFSVDKALIVPMAIVYYLPTVVVSLVCGVGLGMGLKQLLVA